MYSLLPLLFAVLLSLSGRGPQPIKQQQNAISDSLDGARYQKVWKDLFVKRNGMSESYFSQHIHVTRTNVFHWGGGECFQVWYDVVIDWMTYNVGDNLAINISNAEDPELTLPRLKYLSENEIDDIVTRYPYISNIHCINPVEHLKYATRDAAVAAASEKAGGRVTKEKGDFWFFNLYPNMKANGHPYLRMFYEINSKENKCLDQKFDLITGESINDETFCYGVR